MNIGIIGIGNMGYALSVALSKSKEDTILVYDRGKYKAPKIKNVIRADSLMDLVKSSDTIFISVKPIDAEKLLDEISLNVEGKTVVSVVALYPYSRMVEKMPKAKICKIMTSIAAETGKAPVLAYCQKELYESLKRLLERIGEPYLFDEKIIDALVPITGSGPAILAYFLDSLSQYMVLAGVEKDLADRITNLVAYSTSTYVLKKDVDFRTLTKKVTTPSGITIKILQEFDKRTLKGDIVDSIYSKVKEYIKL
ncbi:MAG: pyrroline-5-carboxylate reductase dimerization domain-containing protein [Nitrososphaeria archaeon]|jgi:pyrroline-5-carboxylate reductase